jgi:hypothetical protein
VLRADQSAEPKRAGVDGSDLAAVEELLDEQRDHLTPPRVDLATAVASLTRSNSQELWIKMIFYV